MTSISTLLSPPSGPWPYLQRAMRAATLFPLHLKVLMSPPNLPGPGQLKRLAIPLLPLLHRQEIHRSHSPTNPSEITSSSNNISYDPLNWRTADDRAFLSASFKYKWNWSRRQFKWRFPNTGSCQGSGSWFLKVDLIRADNPLRIQSTFLKWYKIIRGKTFTLIWNWTHRLYESWHLHMRKLHMGDQSFSLTGPTSTHIDMGILHLPTDTHTSYILGRLLKCHPKNTLRRLQAHISSHCMNWEPGFGKGSPHSCFTSIPQSIHEGQSYAESCKRAQGANAAIPSSSPPPG